MAAGTESVDSIAAADAQGGPASGEHTPTAAQGRGSSGAGAAPFDYHLPLVRGLLLIQAAKGMLLFQLQHR